MLYEPFIYQMYNITFTSIPIMFYCLFDFEYVKQRPKNDPTASDKQLYLMEHPKLFEASMKGEYFTLFKFVQYLLYSLFHAIMIYFLCYQFVSGPNTNSEGKQLGIWIPGHIVFGSCIICCNLVLFLRFNNWTGWGEALVYLMILNYFTLMYIESVVGLAIIPDLFYIFDVMFMFDLVWVQMIACATITIALELAVSHYYRIKYDFETPILEESK